MRAKGIRLAERKRQLLARSEDYRRSITAQVQELKAATAWVQRAARIGRLAAPVLLLIAPALGLWVGRRVRLATSGAAPQSFPAPRRAGLLRKLLTGLRYARQLYPLWIALRNRRRRQDPGTRA